MVVFSAANRFKTKNNWREKIERNRHRHLLCLPINTSTKMNSTRHFPNLTPALQTKQVLRVIFLLGGLASATGGK